MDKKRILFVTNGFGMGGAEKLLIDIVKVLKSKRNDVEVLAFFKTGALFKPTCKICKVHILFDSSIKSTIDSLFFRKIPFYRQRKINNFFVNNDYDYLVAFMEGMATDLVAEVVHPIYKLAWIHSDFSKLDIGWSKSHMNFIYNKMNKLIAVSNDAKIAFRERLPNVSTPIKVIYNIIDKKKIELDSNEFIVKNDVFTFLHIGMLRPEKKQERLIRIASRLKQQGHKNFKIQIIGDGPLRLKLETLVAELNVRDCVELLGLKQNPYPYLRACDCFVLCSDYEGYGIAVKEALYLKKLILTTNVTGPREILHDGKYGIIVDNNEDALFYKICDLLDNVNDYSKVLENIKNYKSDNKQIRQQLCNIFS